jgi:hypothetical protein
MSCVFFRDAHHYPGAHHLRTLLMCAIGRDHPMLYIHTQLPVTIDDCCLGSIDAGQSSTKMCSQQVLRQLVQPCTAAELHLVATATTPGCCGRPCWQLDVMWTTVMWTTVGTACSAGYQHHRTSDQHCSRAASVHSPKRNLPDTQSKQSGAGNFDSITFSKRCWPKYRQH